MARSVRISEKSARAISEHWQTCTGPEGLAFGELLAAIKRLDRAPTKARPKRKPRGVAERHVPGEGWVPASKRPSAAEKRERRVAIRDAVFKRSEVNGIPRCEGPGGQLYPKMAGQVRCGNVPTQLAHAFGRGKGRRPESERNCMALCNSCAYAETHNQPSAEFWWEFRADFFESKGYADEARAARDRARFVETRSTLPAAPRLNR